MVVELRSDIEVGNKAKHLFLLKSFGVNVPKFCVISFSEIKDLLVSKGLDYTQDNLKNLEIPDQWIDEIVNYLEGCAHYAVRSSTGVEDGEQQSFAGQFSTFLNVKKVDLKPSILGVCLSAFKSHVDVYRGESNTEISVSVIIQECIEAEVSGVVFTVDPISGNADSCIVNSVYGMGEGLVSGILDADMFEVNAKGLKKSKIANKAEKLVYAQQGGLMHEKVDDSIQDVPSIELDALIELRKTAKLLEKKFEKSQDIEFCIKNRKLFILQSRSITTLNQNSEYLVWDNSNIVESYPGISLPLTFSFISPVYSAVYKQLSSVLGIKKEEIEKNNYTYDNMLGLLRGRVYYNLYSWYKLLSLLPGYSINSGFMEKMMGVSEKFELKDYRKPSHIKEYWNVTTLVFSMLKNAWNLPQMRRRFREKFYEVLKAHHSIKIDQADAVVCMRAYFTFESTLAKEWKAPLVNDFFAMIYYGLFHQFVQKNQKFFKHGHNHYLSGTGKVITVEPARLQQEISRIIREEHHLVKLFSSESEEVIYQWIQDNPSHHVSVKFRHYIQLWGDRCFAELKLETITYRQNPILLIKILKQTFHQVVKENKNTNSEKDDLKLPWLKGIVFNFLRKKAIDTVSERENLRYERTKAFAEVRHIFVRLGELMFKAGVIDDKRDVFYLGKEEIFNYIKGTSIQIGMKELVKIRKIEYEGFMKEPEQSARIRTEDMVYKNHFGESVQVSESDLKGIPCCKGIVRARVKILNSPDDISDLEGKIMITMSTDPGWVSVFPLVSGIIVERGSVLSHAAIVSREMNIPCIVGVKHITSHFKGGELIEMDGLNGTIKIIENA